MIRFFAERAAMLDELRAETERCWGKDDRVLCSFGSRDAAMPVARSSRSGIGHLWTLRDGVVVRGEGYGDRGKALEAAGVS